MEKPLHSVADLPATAREAVEGLVGHVLRDDQQVYIVALDPAAEPPARQRRAAWADLREIMEEMHQSVRESGIPIDETERIIDEACQQVRYGN